MMDDLGGTMKLVISNKKGQAKQVEVEDGSSLYNKKIGDKVSGDGLGLSGYELEIKGGSDRSGFPMRRDVAGAGRKSILATEGVGFHLKRKGMRKRKTVRGNTISDAIAQVNLYVVKAGKEDVFKAAEEDAPAEDAAEEKKEEAPKEEPKAEEKKEDKPAEEKAEEPAKEEASEEKKEEEKA